MMWLYHSLFNQSIMGGHSDCFFLYYHKYSPQIAAIVITELYLHVPILCISQVSSYLILFFLNLGNIDL